MDISTALWAAAVGAGSSIATIIVFGAVAGRRFRNRRGRFAGGGRPPWARGHHGRHKQGHCHQSRDAAPATEAAEA